MISIHAPREGGDRAKPCMGCPFPYFNPRPPRGGRRNDKVNSKGGYLFQSTPPARGATIQLETGSTATAYISIHAPREGGDNVL